MPNRLNNSPRITAKHKVLSDVSPSLSLSSTKNNASTLKRRQNLSFRRQKSAPLLLLRNSVTSTSSLSKISSTNSLTNSNFKHKISTPMEIFSQLFYNFGKNFYFFNKNKLSNNEKICIDGFFPL